MDILCVGGSIPLPEFFLDDVIADGSAYLLSLLGFPVVSASDPGSPLHNDWPHVGT